MDGQEIHYLTYDPQAIWLEMIAAYVEEGGDILYPGDEKEMLLRGVQAVITQVFAAVDNALRMQTLRYATGGYLDLLGESRNCERIEARAAEAEVEIETGANGAAGTIPAGSALTADGTIHYELINETVYKAGAQVVRARIRCLRVGTAGNGLTEGTLMQFVRNAPRAARVTVAAGAANGGDKEEDEYYRERIRLHGLASVTTGPRNQYRSAALKASSEILDAAAVNEGPGNVGVYLILKEGADAQAALALAEDALSAEDTRPLTDRVTVKVAAAKNYALNVEYETELWSGAERAIEDAAEVYRKWQDGAVGRAFNPDRLKAALYQAGATRVKWAAGSQFAGGAIEYTEIAEDERCAGNVTVTNES